jgi:pimeloyl-ACP methyl ester carboxylesterase
MLRRFYWGTASAWRPPVPRMLRTEAGIGQVLFGTDYPYVRRVHDWGSYVAFRMAMEHPEAVTKLAVIDSVPILEALERADEKFARLW